MNQEDAFHLLKMGNNVFLTGAAGSGKTYLLNRFIQYLRKHAVHVAVTASTGIASTHLNGVTLHSWSGIGVREQLSDNEIADLLSKKHIKNHYKKANVLIIDEISMLHPYQLEMADRIARAALDPEQPFGGMQVVVCGDFFQLPPVSLSHMVRGQQFAFETHAWRDANFYVCYLHEQHRQANDPLLAILNDIRNGTAGEHTKIPLRTRYKKDPSDGVKATKLYSHNVDVDTINEKELEKLLTKEKHFAMREVGPRALVEGLKRGLLAQSNLKLKVRAEVMFIKNHPLGRYVNGTRGVVIGFDQKTNWPVVKTSDKRTIIVEEEEWTLKDHAGIVRAAVTQLPLRLAWAITIHKSQGMTLDAAEMDLGAAFEFGMGYVCLSRVRRLSGLKLMNLNEMALKVHPQILSQDPVFKQQSVEAVQFLRQLSKKEIDNREQAMLLKFGSSSRDSPTKIKVERKLASHLATLAFLKKQMQLESIASERGLSLGTVVTHIERLKGLKLIDVNSLIYLKQSIPDADFSCLHRELLSSDTGKLKPVYEKYDGKYSYDMIRIVKLFVEYV